MLVAAGRCSIASGARQRSCFAGQVGRAAQHVAQAAHQPAKGGCHAGIWPALQLAAAWLVPTAHRGPAAHTANRVAQVSFALFIFYPLQWLIALMVMLVN